jgi:hypothetical protein
MNLREVVADMECLVVMIGDAAYAVSPIAIALGNYE